MCVVATDEYCVYLQVPGDLPPHEGPVHLDTQQSSQNHRRRVGRGARSQLRPCRLHKNGVCVRVRVCVCVCPRAEEHRCRVGVCEGE